MIQGTTPIVRLLIENPPDFDMDLIDFAHITIENESGRNQKIFDADIDKENKILSCELTQEDSLNYEKGMLKVQVKIKLTNGRVISHEVIYTNLYEILEKDIL